MVRSGISEFPIYSRVHPGVPGISGIFPDILGIIFFLELQSHIPEIISQVWVQLIFRVAKEIGFTLYVRLSFT